jgi:hypothetical protein
MMQLLVGFSILVAILFIVYLSTADISSREERQDIENKRKFMQAMRDAQESSFQFQKNIFEQGEIK